MTNWFPWVLWHCWYGHLTCKNHPRNDLWCVEWDVKPLHYYYYYYCLCCTMCMSLRLVQVLLWYCMLLSSVISHSLWIGLSTLFINVLMYWWYSSQCRAYTGCVFVLVLFRCLKPLSAVSFVSLCCDWRLVAYLKALFYCWLVRLCWKCHKDPADCLCQIVTNWVLQVLKSL